MKRFSAFKPTAHRSVAVRAGATRSAVFVGTVVVASILSSCTSSHLASSEKIEFLRSGSNVISRAIPTEADSQLACAAPVLAPSASELTPRVLAPLFAFIPPAAAFAPAENETWIEVDTAAKKLRIYKGATVDSEFQAEGDITLQPGNYSLQQKQRTPLWYAPDGYFRKRQLAIPPAGDRLRYLKGALGEYALFPSPDFAIHTAPVWTDDVGGLRVSRADLLAIYYKLNIGSSIVVR